MVLHVVVHVVLNGTACGTACGGACGGAYIHTTLTLVCTTAGLCSVSQSPSVVSQPA